MAVILGVLFLTFNVLSNFLALKIVALSLKNTMLLSSFTTELFATDRATLKSTAHPFRPVLSWNGAQPFICLQTHIVPSS